MAVVVTGFVIPLNVSPPRLIIPRGLPSTVVTRFIGVGSEEAPIKCLASVRRSNWTCSFPASSFHKATHYRRFSEGINFIRLTSPNSLCNLDPGRVFQPQLRHLLHPCDHNLRMIHLSSLGDCHAKCVSSYSLVS